MTFFKKLLTIVLIAGCQALPCFSQEKAAEKVVILDMNMMILPGTEGYLKDGIAKAESEKASLIIVKLDTPGGILETTQNMIQDIFKSDVPVAIYVSPEGGTATSAGVFITMASHVAAMAPGTSIGAATPIQGDGKDIQGDLREKALNITSTMVKSITEQRGRNAEWAQEAVTKAASLTETEALEKNVIDFIARDINEFLEKASGRKVKIKGIESVLPSLNGAEIILFEQSVQHRLTKFLANPSVVALLWLAATTGISIELYNPGLIFPGVVGVICLILALTVSSVIPISQGALMLMVVGVALIGLELFTGILVFGIGGFIAIVIGSLYLIDSSAAPGLAVAVEIVAPIALVIAGLLLFIASQGARVLGRKTSTTGVEGLLGKTAKVVQKVTAAGGKVFVEGEYWNAESDGQEIETGSECEITKVEGLMLTVRKQRS